MTTRPPNHQRDRPRQPYRVTLPGFVRDQDIGLGDVITKSTSALGIRPCGGCAQRAAALNQWMAFGGTSSQRGE